MNSKKTRRDSEQDSIEVIVETPKGSRRRMAKRFAQTDWSLSPPNRTITKGSIYQGIHSLEDLSSHLVKEIERFFISYNEARGKTFRIIGHHGAKRALKILQKATVAK